MTSLTSHLPLQNLNTHPKTSLHSHNTTQSFVAFSPTHHHPHITSQNLSPPNLQNTLLNHPPHTYHPKLTTPTKTSSSHSRNITQSTTIQHNFIPNPPHQTNTKKYIMLIKGNKLFDPKNALVKNLTISNFITIYRSNRFPLIIYYSKLALFLE